MGTVARRRPVHQLSWAEEQEGERARRREALCKLDGLLAEIEEVNVRGGVIPRRIVIALRRCGVAFSPGTPPPDLIEAIFTAQERYMRETITLPGRRRVSELASRIAS